MLSLLDIIIKFGNVPLGIAAQMGHIKVIERLLQAKANINSQNKVYYSDIIIQLVFIIFVIAQDDKTPLYLASLKGHEAVVRLLIKEKADINICSKVWPVFSHLVKTEDIILNRVVSLQFMQLAMRATLV